MINHLRTFFYPKPVSYTYRLSKEVVVATIKKEFEHEVTFFSANDMKVSFLNEDTFDVSIVSGAYRQGIGASSALKAKIIRLDDGNTQIETLTKPNGSLYFWFFIAILMGVLYMYQFVQSGTIDMLLWSLGILVIAPTLIIGISNVGIGAIQERYMMYIHKHLKKLAASDAAATTGS